MGIPFSPLEEDEFDRSDDPKLPPPSYKLAFAPADGLRFGNWAPDLSLCWLGCPFCCFFWPRWPLYFISALVIITNVLSGCGFYGACWALATEPAPSRSSTTGM
jgi:hypothetical protein